MNNLNNPTYLKKMKMTRMNQMKESFMWNSLLILLRTRRSWMRLHIQLVSAQKLSIRVFWKQTRCLKAINPWTYSFTLSLWAHFAILDGCFTATWVTWSKSQWIITSWHVQLISSLSEPQAVGYLPFVLVGCCIS